MPLSPGTKLGQYEVVEAIGAGGMGEVYRARDTKLGRDVAIKVLPEEFARDKDRLDRFEREARLLAQLNHANIATLHGLEAHYGQKFIVMELVEGETLAERIAKGPVPIDEAIPLFIQIAEGLEAAHEKAIIHRDLKPANIKIGPDGKPKILDFGLAKAALQERVSPESPTLTRQGTETGVILGTAAYMSPEQARGKTVDKRTDIWAFGCCLYEALTGRAVFLGGTVSDTLAMILRKEPDWDYLPRRLPTGIHGVLQRCLRKDPARRLQHTGDARIEIQEPIREPVETAQTLTGARKLALWSVLSAILGGIVVWGLIRTMPRDQQVTRLTIPVPSSNLSFAISPDGKRIVYTAERHLFLREMDQSESRPIPGTEGVSGTPFFSPDSRWVGFHAQGKLKKVSVSGGAPITLCDSGQDLGATWGPDDTIVFSQGTWSGLWRVPASGGTPKELTTPDHSQGVKSHRYPHFLPHGKGVLFQVGTTRMRSWDEGRIEVLDLEAGERRVSIEGGYGAFYSHSGHLLYLTGGSLHGVPFDLGRLVLTGTPVPVVSDVNPNPVSGSRYFKLSEGGTLVYAPGDERYWRSRLVLVDRKGKAQPITDFDNQLYNEPSFSPDGRHVAIRIEGANDQVARYDMERGTLTRLTFEWDNMRPVWAPDGKILFFESSPGWNLFKIASDGSGGRERITTSERPQGTGSFSPDGRYFSYEQQTANGDQDVWILPLDDESEPWPFLQSPANEVNPRFSPDGRWMAYRSDESGRREIYLQSFPEAQSKQLISTDGGFGPVWAKSGKELFYREPSGGFRSKMMAVEIRPGDPLQVSKPRMLFENSFDNTGGGYDVTP